MYKDLLWPYHRRQFQLLKSRAWSEIFIFFHCDEAIWDFIPLLIKAGVRPENIIAWWETLMEYGVYDEI